MLLRAFYDKITSGLGSIFQSAAGYAGMATTVVGTAGAAGAAGTGAANFAEDGYMTSSAAGTPSLASPQLYTYLQL